jgi:pyruvate kinase
MKRAKIVATLGPASSDAGLVRELVEAGVDVARLNFSHGDHEVHRATFETVRREADRAGRVVATLADLAGPKIRTGRMVHGGVTLQSGEELVITTEELTGSSTRISTNYEPLPQDVRPGDPILLDDGKIRLVVREVAGRDVRTQVAVGGTLGDRKGINLPGTELSTPAVTDKDRGDIEFARSLGVDFLALSFVRRASDIVEAKRLAGDIPVIAKIEKPEAIGDCPAIVEAADGIMVARGDLGVEAGFEKVPLMQKQLIREAGARGKPVIVATQMLESMMTSPVPTRAEVSDIANAVLDGADALMLSGETAVGRYPVEAVGRMAAVIEEVEGSELYQVRPEPVRVDEYSFSNAIARAAVRAARDLDLGAVVVYTESGHTAELVSAYRPQAPLVAFSRHDEVLRRLALRWGIRSFKIERWLSGVPEVIEQVESTLLAHDIVAPGDDIAITFGVQEVSGPGRTNILKLWRVRGSSGSLGS